MRRPCSRVSSRRGSRFRNGVGVVISRTSCGDPLTGSMGEHNDRTRVATQAPRVPGKPPIWGIFRYVGAAGPDRPPTFLLEANASTVGVGPLSIGGVNHPSI